MTSNHVVSEIIQIKATTLDNGINYTHMDNILCCEECESGFLFVTLHDNFVSILYTNDFEIYNCYYIDCVRSGAKRMYSSDNYHVKICNAGPFTRICIQNKGYDFYELDSSYKLSLISDSGNDVFYDSQKLLTGYSYELTTHGYRCFAEDNLQIPLDYRGHENPKLLVINSEKCLVYNMKHLLILIDHDKPECHHEFENINGTNFTSAIYSKELDKIFLLSTDDGVLIVTDSNLEHQEAIRVVQDVKWSDIIIFKGYIFMCGGSMIAYSKESELSNWTFKSFEFQVSKFKLTDEGMLCFGINGHCVSFDRELNHKVLSSFPVRLKSLKNWFMSKNKCIGITDSEIFTCDC